MDFQSILKALTDEWQSREEIDRKLGGLNFSCLMRLYDQGRVLHMVDASQAPWVHKYRLARATPDLLIGKSHVGRLGAPV